MRADTPRACNAGHAQRGRYCKGASGARSGAAKRLQLMLWGALSCPPQVRNEKARRFLSQMKPKPAVSFAVRFPRAHPSAVRLLERLLAFDPNKRCGVARRACALR